MSIGLIIGLICIGIWLLLSFYIVISVLFLTPYYPSRTKKLEEAIKNLDIKIKPGMAFVDVGSGDGRVVAWAAKKGLNAYGIELNPFLTLWSRVFFLLKGVRGKAEVINQNWNKVSYEKYDIVYLYIFREHMDKLKEKFEEELKPGSIIISNTFRFKDLEPDQEYGRFAIYKINK